MTRRLALGAGLAALALSLALPAVPAAASGHSPGAAARAFAWQERPTGNDNEYRGLAAVSRSTAWVAGTNGSVLRTTDQGRHWRDVSPHGASSLEFRDVEAFDAQHAVVLSIGPGTASQILSTSDGGHSWRTRFVNVDRKAFYDCMTFFDRTHGLAMSDPVNGKFRILATDNGARTWHVLSPKGMPKAEQGEAGFAASGTCIVSSGPRDAWLASGGGKDARVFHTSDRGRHWTVTRTPVTSGPSAGIYALAFRDTTHGLAAGGDYTTPTKAPRALARTSDGGHTWRLAASPPGEYRSGISWLGRTGAVAVGPTGSNVSFDSGRTWTRFDTGSLDAVQCVAGACWGSGLHGRTTYLPA